MDESKKNFLNKTVPLNYFTLGVSLFSIVVILFFVDKPYWPGFLVAIALAIWSAADIIKWHLRRKNQTVVEE